MGIEHWKIVQVRTPEHPPYALPGGLPAELLTRESQWIEGEDPDTGEKTASFVGPVFEGTELELELEAHGAAPGSLGIIAAFEIFRPREGPAAGRVGCAPFCCPPALAGTVERTAVGTIASGSGLIKLAPKEPGPARITITLTAIEADDERPTD